MKSRSQNLLATLAVLAFLSTINSQVSTLRAQGTAFTYQGRLDSDGATAPNGLYDFRFKLYIDPLGNNQAGSTILNDAVPTTNGLFLTTIDFGAGIFTGTNYWLEIDVRTNNTGTYTDLSPFQQVTPTPYAVFANTASNLSGTLSTAQFGGTYGNAVTLNNANNSLTGVFTGDGASVSNVNAALLNGLGASSFWQLGGNNVAAGQILGSTNSQALEVRVANQRVLLITPNPADSANLVGGSPANIIDAGLEGAVIAGGGTTNFQGAYSSNRISANFSSIGGGSGNVIQSGSDHSFIGSGLNNLIASNTYQTVIGGGQNNVDGGTYSVLGGGFFNTNTGVTTTVGGGAYNNASGYGATIAGGGYDGSSINGNNAQANASAIGGGWGNLIPGFATYAVIGGGTENTNATYDGFIGGGYQSSSEPGNATVIGGGYQNLIQSNSYEGTIGGGWNNIITANAPQSTISGGSHNTVTNEWSEVGGGVDNFNGGAAGVLGGGIFNTNNGTVATLGGGQGNFVNGNSATLGGGFFNTNTGLGATVGGGIQNNAGGVGATIGGGGDDGSTYNGNNVQGNAGTIGGGWGNSIPSTGTYATIPGGARNLASGLHSFAAGNQAQATNNAAFVWSDGSVVTTSITNNTVTMRATNGFRFFTSTGVGGAQLLANATAWTTLSDRNAKKDFAPVDTVAVLNKLAAVPIEQWHYKWESDSETRNIGPMAQDFKAAFYPGRDDKGISTLEFDGVELAAIQGLNRKLEDRSKEIGDRSQEAEGEIEALKVENAKLKARLEKLERVVDKMGSGR